MQSPHTPENWSAAAEAYDTRVTDFTTLYADALLERLDVRSDHAVLEVAAGPGNVTVRVAPLARRVLATDYAAGMIERLRGRLARDGIGNVDCAQMDGQALDVEDGAFDRAFSSFGVMLFADRAAGFRELRRALRPGGRAVVSAWSTPERFEAFSIFGKAVRQTLPDLPLPPGPPPIFSLADPEVFTAEMEAAGFTQVRIETVEHVAEQPSPEVFWTMMHDSAPPIRAMTARLGPENTAAVRATLLSELRARFGDGPVRLKAEATIGTGEVA